MCWNGGVSLSSSPPWYVITGGPSSGKSTTIAELASRGYATVSEHAREYIVDQLALGRSLEEIRADEPAMQRSIMKMQSEHEATLDRTELTFLDRALLDALAYFRWLHIEPSEADIALAKKAVYRKVFILDLLPIVQDEARNETADAQRELHSLLHDIYTEYGYDVVHVPVLTPAERADYILERL